MTIAKSARTILASVACVPGTPQRGTIDLEAGYGGVLTLKITNGGIGPTVQCTANVLIAHNASVPSAGSAGADWKTKYTIGGGTTENAVTELCIPIEAGVMALEVEFIGNTGQNVTVESYMSEITAY